MTDLDPSPQPDDVTEPGELAGGSAHAPKPSSHLPGNIRIGRYTLKRVIAAGGMGIVYEAVQERPRRTVALKIMKQGIASRSAMRRFEYESQILARLRHPGIAQVYDAGMHEDPAGLGKVPYFAMEYVAAAKDLIEFAQHHELTTRRRLALFRKVCDAVYHGHQKGIIHRDLKPANILVDPTGQPKIIDFGVARSTDSDLAVTTLQTDVGQLIGTMQFMSPEQIDADPLNIDTRSDVYALGVVLHKLLTDTLPYNVTGMSIYEASHVIRDARPARVNTSDSTIHGDVGTIVRKALERDRDRRYQSALGLGQDIERYLGNHPILARPPSLTYHFRTFARRNRVLVGGVIGIFLALVLGVVGFWWQGTQAQSQRDLAERRFQLGRTLANTLLFDIHDDIQQLDGSTPARDRLVQSALQYLDALAQEVGDNVELKQDLANAYDRVGDLRGGVRNEVLLGDTGGALESFRIARRLREGLAVPPDEEAEFLFKVSANHNRVGDMLGLRGDLPGALAEYTKSAAIRETLAENAPEYRRHHATALNEVGQTLKRMGRLDEARTYYDRVLRIRRTLAAERPDDNRLQRGLSVVHNRVGNLLWETEETDEAMRHFKDALEIRTQLVEKEPQSARYRRDLAVSHYYVGGLHLELKRAGEALPHLQRFLEITNAFVVTNPGGGRAMGDLARAHEAMGRVLLQLGDHVAAADHFDRFAAIIVTVADNDPSNTPNRALVARSHERLGELALAREDHEAAVAAFEESVALLDELIHEAPDDVDLKESHLRVTDLRARAQAAFVQDGTTQPGLARDQ